MQEIKRHIGCAARWASQAYLWLSMLFLLNDDKFLDRLSSRAQPVGLIGVCAVFGSILAVSRQAVIAYSLMVFLVYGALYATIFYFSVKNEYKKGDSFSRALDSVFLAFFLSAVVSFLYFTFAYAISMLVDLAVEPYYTFSYVVLGAVFFMYFLRLSQYAFRSPDLTHIFCASLVPYLGMLALVYYTLENMPS